MFDNINIIKTFISNKSFIKYLIIILVLFITNLVCSFIIDDIEDKLIVINDQYNKLKQLNDNEFILKHLFKEDKNNTQNFINYVNEYLQSSHSKVINIETIDSKQLYNITVDTIQFDLTFIHDKFIFELIELIQNYSPGFVRITDVYIAKVNKFNVNQNNLRVRILCEIYNK